MDRARRFFSLAVAFTASISAARGQPVPGWRVYRAGDGLAESACLSVTVSPQGKVVVRHPNLRSLSELDGYSVKVIPVPEDANGRVYESPAGQLWTGFSAGLQEFRSGVWIPHPAAEIASVFRAGGSQSIDPVPLYPVKQGVVICLLPDRLVQFHTEPPTQKILRYAAETRLDKFLCLSPARDGGLWITATRGLAKLPGPVRNLSPETPWSEYLPPTDLHLSNFLNPHEDQQGIVTAVAESSITKERVAVHFDGQRWTVHPAGNEKIRQAWRGVDGTCSACTISALFRLPEGKAEIVPDEEINARQFFDVAAEPSGVVWLATSEGLFRFGPLCWRTPNSLAGLTSPVHGLAPGRDSSLWFIAGGKLHSLQNDQHEEYVLPAPILAQFQSLRALYALKDDLMVLEAEQNLFLLSPATGEFTVIRSDRQNGQLKILGVLKDRSLCLQNSAPDASAQLQRYDGVSFEPLAQPPSLSIGKDFLSAFNAQNGDLWLSTEQGVACYHDKQWRTFTSTDRSTPQGSLSFIELEDGKIWSAAKDTIWEFDGQDWSQVRGGFDGINAMLRTHDGSVWVASNNGLLRFLKGAWVENGTEEGLPSASVREICEDLRGRLWAATARGLSRFYPEADADPPRTTIQKLNDQEQTIPDGGTFTVSFGAQDKWKLTPRSRLLFSYRLDQRDWSPFQEASTVSFTDLPAGKHSFQVRAMDRNCNLDLRPAEMEFAVVLPWYKEPRLFWISMAGLAAALFFAGLAFNRHWQLVRSYAEVERKVEQRTRELELANRELLHSQKMNALGTIAAGIAHDFNNILSIIKGSAQIIEENLDSPQKVRTRLDRIKMVVEQGAGIVKAMLGFTRESSKQPAFCDLNAVVEETLKLLGDRFLREVEVLFQPAPDLPPIICARDFIQQILLNFIFNAEESMSARKKIILRTWFATSLDELSLNNSSGTGVPPVSPARAGVSPSRASRPRSPSFKQAKTEAESLPHTLAAIAGNGPWLPLIPAEASAYVCVSVQDSGCGIVPENMPRIFEPFFTTKSLSARRGTGLGLSMAYQLARKMEAGLAVRSVVNQGSTFILILPVQEIKSDDGPTKPQEKSEIRNPKSEGNPKTEHSTAHRLPILGLRPSDS